MITQERCLSQRVEIRFFIKININRQLYLRFNLVCILITLIVLLRFYLGHHGDMFIVIRLMQSAFIRHHVTFHL